MKTIWKQTAAVLAACICICNLALPAVSAKTEDSSNNVYLCDEGDFLSDAEFQEAMDELQEAADESGMNVALWIGSTAVGDDSDADTIAFCDETYEELYGMNTDGVFLYLCLLYTSTWSVHAQTRTHNNEIYEKKWREYLWKI